jgi:hypothetical protein
VNGSYVFSPAIYDDKLIAGGFFSTAGGVAANDIAACAAMSMATGN